MSVSDPKIILTESPKHAVDVTTEHIEKLKACFLRDCENMGDLRDLSNAVSGYLAIYYNAHHTDESMQLGLLVMQLGALTAQKWMAEQAVSFEEAKKEI